MLIYFELYGKMNLNIYSKKYVKLHIQIVIWKINHNKYALCGISDEYLVAFNRSLTRAHVKNLFKFAWFHKYKFFAENSISNLKHGLKMVSMTRLEESFQERKKYMEIQAKKYE